LVVNGTALGYLREEEIAMRAAVRRLKSSRRNSSQPPQRRLRVEELESRIFPSANLLAGYLMVVPNVGPAAPSGTISPAQMMSAYSFPGLSENGAGQTIALIDAYNQPNIKADLTAFDSFYGIAAAPSFKVVNQTGGTKLPVSNASWGLEESLDVEWAHAMAPGANLVLIEANSSSFNNLLTAASTAATKEGASVASMSFGGTEFSTETSLDSKLNHSGTTYIASAGDSGSPAQYPSASPLVMSVGGTSLTQSNGAYVSETTWNNFGTTGGGPSKYESKPSWQNGFQTTNNRGTPDVAMDADPSTGVSVYDSYREGGWVNGVGGTSLAAPMWAGIISLANQGRKNAGKGNLTNMPADIYSLSAGDFHDITTGGNGTYNAGPGYDFVTGRGTPIVNVLVPDLINRTNVVVANAGNGAVIQGMNPVGKNLAAETSANGAVVSAATSINATLVTATPVAPVAPMAHIADVNAGVTVGSITHLAAPEILRAHSAINESQPLVPGLENGQPELTAISNEMTGTFVGDILEAAPVARIDSAFTDDAWVVSNADSGSSGTDSEDASAIVNPAAVAGVMVFFGGAGGAQVAEAETPRRRTSNA
jgi:hypothetical protein